MPSSTWPAYDTALSHPFPFLSLFTSLTNVPRKPFTYNTTNNEKELILPAIAGVRSILRAAAATSTVKRIVLTSSFAAVFDADRDRSSYFTYTSADWNPLTYAEAAHPSTSAVVAYRGSKKFAERFAWDFVEERRPGFDLVTLCPPMTFGPVVHPVARAEDLNDSNAMLWSVAKSVSSNGDNSSLPVARVPFWVDVRDLARAHVQALLRPEVGGRRYTVAAPERFSYGLAAKIMAEEFEWARGSDLEEQVVDESYGLDGETAAKELGVTYRSFRETVVELVAQVRGMETA